MESNITEEIIEQLGFKDVTLHMNKDNMLQYQLGIYNKYIRIDFIKEYTSNDTYYKFIVEIEGIHPLINDPKLLSINNRITVKVPISNMSQLIQLIVDKDLTFGIWQDEKVLQDWINKNRELINEYYCL